MSTIAAEEDARPPKLCDFCRPRIHDLSQLGWKERRDRYGNLFLEPETTRRQLPDDTVILSPYTNDIEGVDGGVHYGLFGEHKAQGIEASDNIISVEFYRIMYLPNEDSQDIEPTGCSFCDILTHALVAARCGANKPWNYPFPIYSLKFHFEFKLMFLKEDTHGTVLSDRRMLLKHIVVEYQPRISLAELIFPVGVLPGRITAKELNMQHEAIVPDLLDAANIAKFQGWLRRCDPNTHPYCHNSDESPFFFRLLDIGIGSEEQNFKLVEMQSEGAAYIALSYCWGAESAENRNLKTTKSTLHDFLAVIPWSQLPPNFSTIIKLARSLGFRYIWIDSLCIIQDDDSDWTTQASQMDSIYRNARLTIVTASAVSPNDDIQQRKIPQNWREMPWKFSSYPGLEVIYLLEVSGAGGTSSANYSGNRFEDIPLSRWNSRAWTFQERFLSRRMMYLGKHGAYWECLGGRLFETRLRNEGDADSEELPPFSTDYIESRFKSYLFGTGLETSEPRPTIETMHDLWRSILNIYTRRYLTFDTDTIAALAGLAKALAEIMKRIDPLCDTYYFGGVWRMDIKGSLLWHIEYHLDMTNLSDNVFIPSRDALSSKPRGATWLWSCVSPSKDGPPRWDHKSILKFEILPPEAYIDTGFEILSLETSENLVDNFTRPDPQGTLHVRGRLKEIPVTIIPFTSQHTAYSLEQKRAFDIGLNQGRRASGGEDWQHYCYWTQQASSFS
ncbi:hypothetical protein IFR05_010695 [Cadophora sp. M221]|nr:hypothetical protein IFR05_010695 [Cadophora sp. M221]